eukprot:SAG31_NODE_8487_length_1442_cov_1.461653_1_plen_197_part_00
MTSFRPKYDTSVTDVQRALSALKGEAISLDEAYLVMRFFGCTKALSTKQMIITLGVYGRGDWNAKAKRLFKAFEPEPGCNKATFKDIEAAYSVTENKIKAKALALGVLKLGDSDKKGYLTAEDCEKKGFAMATLLSPVFDSNFQNYMVMCSHATCPVHLLQMHVCKAFAKYVPLRRQNDMDFPKFAKAISEAYASH